MGDHFKPPTAEDFGKKLATIAPLQDFLRHVDSKSNATRGDVACCQAEFAALLQSDFLRQLLHHELVALVDEPAHVVHQAYGRVWQVVETPNYVLNVYVYPPKSRDAAPTSLTTSAHDYLLGVAGRSPLQLQLYHTPHAHDPSVLDPNERLTVGQQVTLQRSDTLAIRAAKDLFVVAPHDGHLVTCTFELPNRVDRVYLYDPETLRPMLASAANTIDSRLQLSAQVLALFGHREAVPTLERLLEHPSHFVRWSVLQQLASLDGSRARVHLHNAAHDPHPRIRTAATRALQQLAPEGHHGAIVSA